MAVINDITIDSHLTGKNIQIRSSGQNILS
jgi:hypothetical protein